MESQQHSPTSLHKTETVQVDTQQRWRKYYEALDEWLQLTSAEREEKWFFPKDEPPDWSAIEIYNTSNTKCTRQIVFMFIRLYVYVTTTGKEKAASVRVGGRHGREEGRKKW